LSGRRDSAVEESPFHLGLLPAHHARYRADRTAVVFESERISFAEFDRRINRASNALAAAGLVKGDRFATVLPNCLELLELYWAAARTGMVIVPLSILLRGSGLSALLSDSESAAVITTQAHAAALDEMRGELGAIPPDRWFLTGTDQVPGWTSWDAARRKSSGEPPTVVEIRPDDPYNIIYSSGTTGLPKGIVHTHRIRIAYCTLFASAWRMTPESVILHAGSIVFNGAFLTLMPWMYLGTTFVLQRQFEPDRFQAAIRTERATHVMMVPSQIVALLRSPGFSPEALSSLEMICSVGAPLHDEHKEELERKLPRRLYELYGLTEGFLTILDRDAPLEKRASVGVPPQFFEMRIETADGREAAPGEVGEIVGRGPLLMAGYYRRPELSAEAVRDGWLYSGDLGFADEDGYLHLVDRKKDMIASGGINVFPRDIEEVAVRHPAIREVAVFGIPDEKWGEVPLAAIILREPEGASAEELKAWINERVSASYQRVRDVVLYEDFPRSAAGKTLKREMRERYWSGRTVKI
jgi:acyl-CoA synthetase (AMP-forming)/AMP-acid ligase II